MFNVFHLLSEAFAAEPGQRAQAISITLDEAYQACCDKGIDLYADDLREGLRALVRLAPREEIADAKRLETLVEMQQTLREVPPRQDMTGPRGARVDRLRQCAFAWRAFADAQGIDPPDHRGVAIQARWTAEAALLDQAAAEPSDLYIAREPDKRGQLIYGRIAADHDFEDRPVAVVFTDPYGADMENWLGPIDALPPPWRALVDNAGVILAAVYEREHVPGSALSRLKGGMPSGVIAGAGVLELHVLYDQPGHVGTAYGRDPIAIVDIIAEAVTPVAAPAPKILANLVVDALRETAEQVSDMEGVPWSDGLTLAEWERQVLEIFRGQFSQ
jgi:hypothetical protein